MRTAPTLFALLLSASLVTSAAAAPLTIVGTSDLHGRIERLPVYGGHLAALRAAARKAQRAVVVVDAGDMFQGTLESNLVEGKAVVAAYNALGIDAAAIGNHELDYGPVGPLAMPKSASDDPRGALKARAAEARFPFLAANLIDDATGKPVSWPNVKTSTIVRRGGIAIGVLGITTKDTAATTVPANVKGLHTAPLLDSVVAEAQALRKAGAHVVVVAAHAGGKCTDTTNPSDVASCDAEAEIFQLARALPPDLVNVIVAGHTHSTVAHVVNGIAIVESWANGKGFGRVDLDFDKATKKVTVAKVHPPQPFCVDDEAATCTPTDYEGTPVKPDAAIAKVVKPYLDAAKAAKDRPLGVTVASEVARGYDQESALGNLFADLMLQASATTQPPPDLALMNGGGIRTSLPAGALTYGHVFAMMPFDNRFARVSLLGKDLRAWLATNLSAKKGGILSIAGANVDVTCTNGAATVRVVRKDGRPIGDAERVTVVTTDFVATGGDHTNLTNASVVLDDGEPVREALAKLLQQRGGTLRGDDPALYDPAKPRIRPGRCAAATTTAPPPPPPPPPGPPAPTSSPTPGTHAPPPAARPR